MACNLALLVKNQAGVLSRISNSFSRRGYNIASIAAGSTQDPDVTRITVQLDIDQEQVELVINQLYKLPEVLMVRELPAEESFVRELALVKVRADSSLRQEIVTIVDIFRGGIVDVSSGTITVQITGAGGKLEAFVEMLKPYHIMEIVRTGLIAIDRGQNHLDIRLVDGECPAGAVAAGDAAVADPDSGAEGGCGGCKGGCSHEADDGASMDLETDLKDD